MCHVPITHSFILETSPGSQCYCGSTRFHVFHCVLGPGESRTQEALEMRLLWLLLPVVPAVFAENNSDPLFWGTYRPNLYFGLRPKVPQSLMTGLMWFGTQDYQSITRAHRPVLHVAVNVN